MPFSSKPFQIIFVALEDRFKLTCSHIYSTYNMLEHPEEQTLTGHYLSLVTLAFKVVLTLKVVIDRFQNLNIIYVNDVIFQKIDNLKILFIFRFLIY